MDKTIPNAPLKELFRSKIEFLDGIRGLMAFCVIITHFVVIYLPQMYFRSFAESSEGFLSLFASTPLSVFVNGNPAVQYFFILTGFLVGRSFFLKEHRPGQLLEKSFQRYTRLLPLVAITTFFTWLTMKLGLQYHLRIAQETLNPEYLSAYCNFEPSLKSLLINAFIYPFIRYSEYVGPFWTIRYEFFGYIISMAVCYVCKESRWRKCAYAVVALLLFSQLSANYIGFILGVFIADLIFYDRPDILEPFYRSWIHSKAAVALILLVGLYFTCCPMYFATIYAFFERIPKITPEILHTLGIAMVLYSILHMPKVQQFFAHPFFLFLGKLSFPVYAFHWPIMLTVEAWLFSLLIRELPYYAAAVLAFLITIPVIYGFSWLIHLLLESKLWRKLFSRKAVSTKM